LNVSDRLPIYNQTNKAMKVNDILLAQNLYCDMYWFLQVVKATEKTVTLRRIRSNKMAGTPCPNQFNEWDDKPIVKRIGKDGRISLGSWESARLWDGKPLRKHNGFEMNGNLY